MGDGVGDAEGGLGQAMVVEGVGEVGELVVVGIAQEAGVGDHEGGVVLVPEGAVVGETNFVDALGEGDGEERKLGGAFEAAAEGEEEF